MRTKTLLLTAALAAAGTLASNAQVYSVNAVGYVNKTVPAKGFALISNPLLAPTNTVASLFSGQVPAGFKVYLWNTTKKSFDVASYDPDFGWDPEAVANTELKPGGGAFVNNPSTTDVKVTFVGEVPQGTGAAALTTPLVPGFQIVSSQVPQAGSATDLGYPSAAGDKIYQWNTSKQAYDVSTYDPDFGWDPTLKSLDVGDAFFLNRTTAGSWTREFSVNQ